MNCEIAPAAAALTARGQPSMIESSAEAIMRFARAVVLLGVGASGCTGPAGSGGGAADLGSGIVVVGTIVDLTSQPLSGATVRLCEGSCRATTSDATGAFRFDGVAALTWDSLGAEMPGSSDYGKVVIPLYPYTNDLQQQQAVLLPPLVLPRLGPSTALPSGPREIAIDATLTLTVDGSALQLPEGSATGVAGARVPSGLFPDFCLPGAGGQVIAEWALAPFGARSSAPIAVHLAENLGLARGAVWLFRVDTESGRPIQVATGSVSADGTSIASDPGVGLDQLTWLLVARPGGGGP
jgi:hypothetical protein